jgi:hypothetical protein
MYCFKLSDVPDVNVTGRRPNVRGFDERFVNYPMGTKVVLFPEANFAGTGIPLLKFGTLNSTMNVRSIMVDRSKLRQPFVLCKDGEGKDCSLPIKGGKSTHSVVYDNVNAIFGIRKKVERVARVIPGPIMSDLAQVREFFLNMRRQNPQQRAANANANGSANNNGNKQQQGRTLSSRILPRTV